MNGARRGTKISRRISSSGVPLGLTVEVVLERTFGTPDSTLAENLSCSHGAPRLGRIEGEVAHILGRAIAESSFGATAGPVRLHPNYSADS